MSDLAASAAVRTLADLPGPRVRDLVADLITRDAPQLHRLLERWAVRFGPVYRLDVPGRRTVVISDPALIDAALRDRPDGFRRDSRFEPVFRELGVAGVFVAEGRSWRPQRKLAVEALAQRHLRSFFPTLAAVAARLHRRWTGAAEAGAEVDLLDDFMRFAVDVTTALAFGHDLQTLDGGHDAIARHLEQFFPTLGRRIRAVVPWWRFVRLPSDRRTDAGLAALRTWVDAQVARGRAALAADPARAARPTTFLEAMLVARDEDDRPFTDDVIFANAVTMLLAGEETTAATLTWSVHHLLDAPVEVAALRAELASVLGGAAIPTDLEACGRLERAAAIGQEAMRLRPPAPAIFLETNHDLVLGDLALPRGTSVLAVVRVPARDPDRFTDPDGFRPDRWIAPGRAHDAAAHLPFGAGPRLCPGRGLAVLEMRVALATLYGSFDVERVGAPSAVREKMTFTLAPVGVRVRLRRRT